MQPSTIQLLRFHFSLFLLPVYLFAISQLPQVNMGKALLIFFVLHLLVYPASNGYNSYMDRDATPIGGLQHPMQPTRQLFYTTIWMDISAVIISYFVNPVFAVGILFYILASRAYSYRRIRLKRFPVTGFLTVFIFQGALIFFITYCAAGNELIYNVPKLGVLIASLLIGASYPLTQIYQHQQDREDGVITLSYILGKRGTFVFSLLLFSAATFLMYQYFFQQHRLNHFLLFLVCMLPVVLFFTYWMYAVWRDEKAADFKHSLQMNLISTLCLVVYFVVLILIKNF